MSNPNQLIVNDPMINNLCIKMANAFHRRSGHGDLDLDDLVQEARLGMVVAAHHLEGYQIIDGYVIQYVKNWALNRMKVYAADFHNSCISIPSTSFYRGNQMVQSLAQSVEDMSDYTNPELEMIDKEHKSHVHQVIAVFLLTLKLKEKAVFRRRIWTVSPESLRSVGKRLNISHEWVRAIENNVRRKLKVYTNE